MFKLCEIIRGTVSLKSGDVSHPKILGRIFSNFSDSIAVETPVWKVNECTCNTGHIDINFAHNLILYVGDYKKNVYEILTSLPQLTAYAVFLKERLSDIRPELVKLNIKCVGFCRDLAVEFDPEVIKFKLLSFVEEENKKRQSECVSRLMTQPSIVKEIRKDLYIELKKALF